MSEPVWIIGTAMTPIRRHLDRDVLDLASEASLGALDDAGASIRHMQVMAVGSQFEPFTFGQDVQKQIGQTGIPLYNVHNACATGATAVRSVQCIRPMVIEADEDQTLRHRHFRTSQVKRGGSPTLDRIPLLFNQDIAMLYVEPDREDEHAYRNAQADEVVYVSKGGGVLESPFGDLPFPEVGRRGRHPEVVVGVRVRDRPLAGERPAERRRPGATGSGDVPCTSSGVASTA